MFARARSLIVAGTLGLVLAASSPVLAQEPEGQPPAVEEPAPDAESATEEAAAEPALRPSNAPFMGPLGRLSSILGSVHFLRTLCGDDDAGIWRDRMNDLIVAQKPNDADRRILIAHFNSGYRAFESTYRQCTPAADVATRRYLEEGAALSRDISARYGN